MRIRIIFAMAALQLIRVCGHAQNGQQNWRPYGNADAQYVFRNGRMERLKKDKSFVMGLMEDKKDKATIYVTEHKLSFKDVDQIRQLVDYYNSIP